MSPRAAVFLDRDGTIIEHVHRLSKAGDVRLIDGAAGAIKKLQSNGFLCIVVTNQSVVGRGIITNSELGEIHAEMDRQLAEQDIVMDGLYFCPVVPGTSDQTVVEHVDRKPGPGMLLRAAKDHTVDLGQSWMIGDSLSDLLAGKNAGCRGSILVLTGLGQRALKSGHDVERQARDLWGAAQIILSAKEGTGP